MGRISQKKEKGAVDLGLGVRDLGIICEGGWFNKTIAFQEVQSETEGLEIGAIGLTSFRRFRLKL